MSSRRTSYSFTKDVSVTLNFFILLHEKDCSMKPCCQTQAFRQTLKTGRPEFTFSRKRMRD